MKSEQSLSDSEIIKRIRKGGNEMEEMASFMLNEFKGYRQRISAKVGLSQDDLNDAYTDAIIKTIRQVKNGSFNGKSKLSTYFFSIFRNTAVDVFRKKTTKQVKETELFEHSSVEKDLMSALEIKDRFIKTVDYIKNIGEPCASILLDWAYFGYSMKEIAQRNSLSNEESARSMKYKCLKKLKASLNY